MGKQVSPDYTPHVAAMVEECDGHSTVAIISGMHGSAMGAWRTVVDDSGGVVYLDRRRAALKERRIPQSYANMFGVTRPIKITALKPFFSSEEEGRDRGG